MKSVNLDWANFGDRCKYGQATGHQSATAIQTFIVDSDPALSPNTRYDYRILATADANSLYALADATTNIGAPDRPQSVTATADGEDTIKVEWTAPNNNGSPIDVYEVQMWDRVTKTWGWNSVTDGVHSVSHPVTTFTHSNLDAGTQNVYRVHAVNNATNDNGGVGKWSTIVSAKTDEAGE